MGLDITAYSKLTLAPDAERDEDGNVVDYDRHFQAWAVDWTEKHWPGRASGIAEGAIYTFSDSFSFRAGSYSGYGAWRDWLAKTAGYGSAESVWDQGDLQGPFVELIHFADNEGVISAEVSAKLARDFAEHEATIAGEEPRNTDYMDRYRNWRKAFEMAADGGAVDFH